MSQQLSILGFGEEWLVNHKAIFTASEINGQPQLWKSTLLQFQQDKDQLEAFLNDVLKKNDLDIILTGAGTSAYIGEILEGYFKKYTGKSCRAVHTTDLVSFPEDYLYKDKTTLLISFARSGNSPESVGAVDIVNQVCPNAYHLIITCNEKGKLASYSGKENTFCFVLPPESNDKSLAMTGSFTSMLLSGILIARINESNQVQRKVEQLVSLGQKIIDSYASTFRKVAELPFTRAIFLGSGALMGAAREADLKVQELSDGKVVGKHDSYLGFRHGPKAIINEESLIVFLFSNDPYARKYEFDLVKEISERKDGMFRIGVGKGFEGGKMTDLHVDFKDGENLDETMLAVVSIIPAQLLAFYKSIQLGLQPDSPSVSGNISRVVKGVTIYPYYTNVETI